jgi:branched-chain amino acid transport system permease protein
MRIGVRELVLSLGLIGLAAVPTVAALLGEPFYIDLFRRVLIFAIAAVSLDLILGYGGMVSFGHAVYLGIGAYVVGILAVHGVHSGFVQWPAAMLVSLLVSLLIGLISLRTSGVYFIMITLAFAQMLYYLGISVEEYGGDDGMRLAARSRFAGPVNLDDPDVFYYVVLGILVLALAIGHRLVNSRFGRVVRAAHSNERRAEAVGFPAFRYKLTAFALAGSLCGLAGALLANQTEYITPSFSHWTRSGEIMFMVILGGMGTLVGPVLGAMVLLVLEDVLSGYTEHWQIVLGPFLVLVVLFAKRGLLSLLPDGSRRGA